MGITIYITEEQLRKISSINRKPITKYRFLSRTVSFIKRLLDEPTYKGFDDVLEGCGLNRKDFLISLMNDNIIKKTEKIKEVDGRSMMVFQYKVPKKEFKRKIYDLYDKLVDRDEIISENKEHEDFGIDNMISDNGISPNEKMPVNEDGAGGATSCAGVGAIGNGMDSSGEYTVPLFGIVSRELWNPHRNSKKKKRHAKH